MLHRETVYRTCVLFCQVRLTVKRLSTTTSCRADLVVLPSRRVRSRESRNPDASGPGRVDGNVISRVCVPKHAHAGIVGENPLQPLRRLVGAICDDDDAGVNRPADTDSPAVVNRYPGRA